MRFRLTTRSSARCPVQLLTLAIVVSTACPCATTRAGADAAPPDGGRQLRCAVLSETGASGTGLRPFAELLEIELAGRPGLTLVDRAEIEHVLREQQVAEALAAGETAKRVALGRLLRADLLVLLRAGEAPLTKVVLEGEGAQPPAAEAKPRENRLHAWVAVCETRHGMRLGTSAIPLTPDVHGDAVAAAGRVDAAVEKTRDGIRAVIAVPPFLSRDLFPDADRLKAACAKLVEQALLARPGVVAVELDEARALAQELALAGGPDVRRAAPAYLMGEYRTDRPDPSSGASRVSVSLSLRRGDRELAITRTGAVTTDRLPAALSQAVDELDHHFGRGEVQGLDREARALAARAREFYVVGDWAEAAALYEASLLLDPRQLEPRLELALSLQRIPLTRDERTALQGLALRRPDAFPEDRVRETAVIEHVIAGYERRLSHLEIYLRDGTHEDPRPLIWEFGWPPIEIGGDDHGHESVAGFSARIGTATRESFLRVIRSRLAEGAPRDGLVRALLGGMPWRVGRETPEDGLRLMLDVLREVSQLPDAPLYATTLALKSSQPGSFGVSLLLGTPEHEAFMAARKAILLDPLLGWPDPRVATAVERAERSAREMSEMFQRERAAAVVPTTMPVQAPAAGAPAPIEFRPFEPKLIGPDGQPVVPDRGDYFRWKPLDSSIDVAWTRRGVWLVREPGRAEPAFSDVAGAGAPRSLSYDGRFLWATFQGAQDGDPPVLLARDVRPRGRTWRVNAGHGLPIPARTVLPSFDPSVPSMRHVLSVAGVEPGTAVVAGYFGRTWIATVTLDEAAGPNVEVFHEAREVPAPRSTTDERWSNPSLAFEPDGMFTIHGEPGAHGRTPRRVVVLGRGDRPLLVDPDARAVSVTGPLFPHSLPTDDRAAAYAEHAGALYVITAPSYKGFRDYGQPRGPHLYRIGFPELEPVAVMTGVPQSFVRFHRGRAIIIGRGAWLLELEARRAWPQAASVPWFHVNLFWNPDDPLASVFPSQRPAAVWSLNNVFTSNHYGLLVLTSDVSGGRATYRAEFGQP